VTGHGRHCRSCSSSMWVCRLGPPLSELRPSARACSSRQATALLPGPRPSPGHGQPRWRCCRPQALVAPSPPSRSGKAVCTGGCAWAPGAARAPSPSATASPPDGRPSLVLLCSAGGMRKMKVEFPPGVSLSYMTNGPGQTVGPICRFK
jgi:hypothetical protein